MESNPGLGLCEHFKFRARASEGRTDVPTSSNGIGRCLLVSCGPMKTKPSLTLDDVRMAAVAAETLAREHGWAVSIAVVDDGGHLMWLQRLDGAAPISAEIAAAKARTAAMGRRETRGYEEMINGGRTAFLSVPVLQGMLEGGVPIVVEGVCVGAVGVSGVKSSEDAQIARAGLAALGA